MSAVTIAGVLCAQSATRLVVGLVLAGVVLVIAAVAWSMRLRSNRFLATVARELGCAHHGSTFRGRFMGRAVRGDAEDMPATFPPGQEVSFVEGIRQGLASALGAAAAFGRSAGRSVVRLRVELISQGVAKPDAIGAAAAVRKHLRKSVASGEKTRPLYEVSRDGTEVLMVLRGEIATPEVARRLVELAIDSSTGGSVSPADSRSGEPDEE